MKWLYRLGSLCAVCAITLSLLIVPASAATLDRSISLTFNRGGSYSYGTINTPRFDSQGTVVESNAVKLTAGTKYYASLQEVLSDSEYTYTGTTGLYLSFYFICDSSYAGAWTTQTPTIEGFYTNQYGKEGLVPSVDVDVFTPFNSSNTVSTGWTWKATFEGTPDMPISGLGIRRSGGAAQAYWTPTAAGDLTSKFYVVVPSAQIIGVESTAELDALESMADSIAAQSEILSAMYGDVVSICNAIYERTGDMLAAQNLANSYFQQIIPILNVISSNTSDIASTTNNIYSLLQTQFNLLISTIQSESFDIQEVIKGESEAIQDAIDSAVEKLITYFDTVFSGAVGDTPDSIQGADDIIKQENDFTSQGFDTADDYMGVTIPDAFTPPSNVLGGFSVIKNLFESLFAVLGDFGMIWVFGWVAGLCALVLGRLRRFRG